MCYLKNDHRVSKIPAKTMGCYSIYIDNEGNWVFRAGSTNMSLLEIPEEPSHMDGFYRVFDNNIWTYIKKY